MPDLAAQLPEFIFIGVFQIVIGDHRMGQARVTQLYIRAGVAHTVHFNGMIQHHGRGIVQADAVKAAVDALSRHNAGCGLHGLLLSGQTVFIAVAADASGTVAAHFADAAVRIVKQHFVVAARSGGLHDHQAVSTNGEVPLAESPGHLGKTADRQMLFQIVYNQKVVSGAVHFPKFQYNTFLAGFCCHYNSTQ